MKKIGIITLFGYNNYGNRLQMFAVQQVYKSLGFDSEIIKYELKSPKDPFIIRIKVFVHYLLFLRTNLKIDYLKYHRISSFKKHAKLHYKESSEINPLNIDKNFYQNYSFFSVGSDQIWGWFIHRIADFVFLKFAPKEKRIAFSPSFGSSTIDEKYRNKFSEGLNGFTFLSVREESGAEIIKNFAGQEAMVICDPTMCISKTEWLAFSTIHKRKPKGKYILTYFLGEPSENVKTILNQFYKDFEIVELNSLKTPRYYAIDPSEFVDFIDDAHLFLTDSFHGIVFSIILKTPFAVYSRIGGEDMQTRITNILDKFSLQNRFEITLNDDSIFKMDFSKTEEIIETEKSKVFEFLKKSLNQ
jgi:hypothetical protein